MIVAAWVTAAIAATQNLPAPGDGQTDSLEDLVATDAEAIDAEVRSAELFAFPLLSRTVVVQRDPAGLNPASLRQSARNVARIDFGRLPGLEEILFALPLSNVFGQPPFSRESSTTALTYLFFEPDVGASTQADLANLYVERRLNAESGMFTGVTGAAPARAEQLDVINDALPFVEIATVALVCVALALHFRALLAPLVNLAAVAVSYLIAIRVVAALAREAGIVAPAEIEPVMIGLLFGVVTDYSIFFHSRFASRLADGASRRDAASQTVSQLMPIVLVAGTIVVAATATLVLARLSFFQAFGPGLAVSLVVALAVSTTLVPALLAIFGRAVFWPAGPRLEGGAPRGGWLRSRLGRVRRWMLSLPTKHPLIVAAATIAPLLALSSQLLDLNVGNRTITALPEDSEPRVAYREASMGFAPGVVSPTVVIAEGTGITDQRSEIADLQRLIAQRPGVAEVIGPAETRLPIDLGAVSSESGDAVRYFVVLDTDPYGAEAIGTVDELSSELPGMLRNAGLSNASASVAGDTAISAETVSTSREDLARVVPAAALVVFLILALFLRALVAPLYLVLTSLLALAASLGLTVLVFQDLLGHGDIAFYVPFAATVLLVAFGSDYNTYLVGRVWQEARSRPLQEAVAVANQQAAAPIAAAGLVLAASFAAIALVPLLSFRELAFAVSAGLILDAFVVRPLLTPALITLIGERSGWPGHRLREH